MLFPLPKENSEDDPFIFPQSLTELFNSKNPDSDLIDLKLQRINSSFESAFFALGFITKTDDDGAIKLEIAEGVTHDDIYHLLQNEEYQKLIYRLMMFSKHINSFKGIECMYHKALYKALVKLKNLLPEDKRKLFDELVEQPADELYLQHIEKLIEIQEPFPEYDQKFTESLRYKLANRPRQINIESILDQ